MKRIIISLIAASLALTSAFALSGCGSQSSSSSKSEAKSEASADASKGDSQSGAIPASDAVFSYNGASVELNTPMDDVLKKLGEAKNVSSQTSCHGKGEDFTYEYEGFIVHTYPLDGKNMVLEVVVKAEGIPTSKGIKVGSTAEEVKAAYGDNFKEVGIYYAYDAGDKKSLQFLIEDGTVKEIDYYYNV